MPRAPGLESPSSRGRVLTKRPPRSPMPRAPGLPSPSRPRLAPARRPWGRVGASNPAPPPPRAAASGSPSSRAPPRPRAPAAILGSVYAPQWRLLVRAVSFVHRTRPTYSTRASPGLQSRGHGRKRVQKTTPNPGSWRGTGGRAPRHPGTTPLPTPVTAFLPNRHF